MDAFIRAIVNAAIGGVRDLAAAAMERMLWLYAIVVTVGTAIRDGWNIVTGAARFWTGKAWTFGAQIYLTLWYIIWIRIPTVINSAVDSLIVWASWVINDLETRLTIGLILVRNWLVDRINELLDWLERLGQYIARRFGEIWEWLDRIIELVFTLLTSPERMVAWLFGALVKHLLRYLNENADSLLDLIRRRSVHYAGLIAVRIEEVLVRLL